MDTLGRDRKKYVDVNPSFGEYLHGFQVGYTDVSNSLNPKAPMVKPEDATGAKKLTGASTFSGCDGLCLGLENYVEVAMTCEKDKACVQLLRKRFPKSVHYNDINMMQARALVKAAVESWPPQQKHISIMLFCSVCCCASTMFSNLPRVSNRLLAAQLNGFSVMVTLSDLI